MVLILNFVMWGVAVYRGRGPFSWGRRLHSNFGLPPYPMETAKKNNKI